MAIKNPDGSVYTVSGSIEQYDPEDPQHELFNLWDQEAIRQGGSPIFYYEAIIPPQDIDPVYPESRGKIFSQFPVMLYCTYDPQRSQQVLSAFGIDGADEMEIELNYKDVLQRIGHAPLHGSRLFTPHRQENWEIVQRNMGEFKMWGALRLSLVVRKFQESLTTGEGKVTKKNPMPKFKIN